MMNDDFTLALEVRVQDALHVQTGLIGLLPQHCPCALRFAVLCKPCLSCQGAHEHVHPEFTTS